MKTQPSVANFNKTTFLWGNITLSIGLILATFMPFYLMYFTDVNVTWGQIFTAWVAVASVFGVISIIEPISYFPILGQAGMYQAFMIGNISNKLVPSAIVAQSSLNAKPGTTKGSFVATAAICGAASVHVFSLLVFVGLLGTWLITKIPPEITDIVRTYILPAIMGGVSVQLATATGQGRIILIAVLAALLVVLALTPLLPAIAPFAIVITVVLTIIGAWIFRDKSVTVYG